MSPVPYRLDRLLLAVVFLGSLGVPGVAVGIALPELIEEFGMGTTVAALHGSMFGLGMVISGLFAAEVVRRVGRRRTLEGAAGGIVVGATAFILGSTWTMTLAGATIAGTSTAVVATIAPSVISDHFGEQRTRAFALLSATPIIVALSLSVGVGLSLRVGGSWRPVFAAVLSLLALGLIATGRSVVLPNPPARTIDRRSAIASRQVRRGLLGILVATATDFAIGMWAVIYLHDVGGASTGTAALLSTVMPISGAASRLGVHRWIDRVGRGLIVVAYVGTGLAVVLLCIGPTLGVRVAALGMIGLFAAPISPLTTAELYARSTDVFDSVTISTLAATTSGLAMWLVPLALGGLAEVVGLRWAVLLIPVMATVGVVLSWSTTRRPILT